MTIQEMLSAQYNSVYSKLGCETPDVNTKELSIHDLGVRIICEVKREKSLKTSYYTKDTTTITITPPSQSAYDVLVDYYFDANVNRLFLTRCGDFHKVVINSVELGISISEIASSLTDQFDELCEVESEFVSNYRNFLINACVPVSLQALILFDESSHKGHHRYIRNIITIEISPLDETVNQAVCDYFNKSSLITRCNWRITRFVLINGKLLNS